MASVIDIHGLAPLQEGMLFHTLYGPESGVYVEQRWCVILGDLNIKVFQDTWNQAILRHTALRAAHRRRFRTAHSRRALRTAGRGG